jgi:hypothetical protein
MEMEHVDHDARSSRQPSPLSSSRSCGAGRTLDELDSNGTVLIGSLHCQLASLLRATRKWQDELRSSHIAPARLMFL